MEIVWSCLPLKARLTLKLDRVGLGLAEFCGLPGMEIP